MSRPVQLIPDGTPLQVADSSGREICMGDYIKRDVSGNRVLHGDYSIHRVICQGPFPVIEYVTSATGKQFPTGYTAGFLSDSYDRKTALFVIDTRNLEPCDDAFYVIDKADAEAFIASQDDPFQNDQGE